MVDIISYKFALFLVCKCYIVIQLMNKKIVVKVDKLISRQKNKQPLNRPILAKPEKKNSFDQMYRQAKRTQSQSNNINASSQFYNHHSSPNGFQTFYESLKASRNTPNSTHRQQQENNRQKLNRSLETKSNSIEKSSPIKRSTSSQRHKFGEKKAIQSNVFHKKKPRQERTKANSTHHISEWQGLQQFQTEWKQVITRLDHTQHEHLRQTECFLSLAQIFQILRSMHYLRKVEDERLLLSLWKQLEGETYGGIPSNNLRQFLTIVNYCPSNICYQHEKNTTKKRIIIDGNLKIVISENAKLQIYEQYLGLRVNRILYGSNASPSPQVQAFECQKNIKNTSNIKIQEEQNTKKKIILGPPRKLSEKQNKPQLVRQKRSEEITRISEEEEKQHNEDTICYSEFSESKESGKILTSNESENSISNTELIEEVVIKRPILSVDVNLGDGLCEKLTVFEGQTALEVSKRLVEKYNIDESLRAKFEAMLSGHIRNLLYRIDEVSQEMFSDRQE